jgi:hypothetical protein
MEMDPNSRAFTKVFGNVFSYTAFKSTEPHLVEYVTLDLHGAMQQVRALRALRARSRVCLTSTSAGVCVCVRVATFLTCRMRTLCVRLRPQAGFSTPAQLSNSPRHRTVVAQKPLAA